MVSVSADSDTHPAFRLAEKHFKNRTTASLPALRGLPEFTQPVLDLSRPGDHTADPVWQAGWWAEEYSLPSSAPRRRKKGKGRAIGERGERPPVDLKEVPVLRLKDGRTGYLVAEGELRSLRSKADDRLRPDSELPLCVRAAGASNLRAGRVYAAPEPLVPRHAL